MNDMSAYNPEALEAAEDSYRRFSECLEAAEVTRRCSHGSDSTDACGQLAAQDILSRTDQ